MQFRRLAAASLVGIAVALAIPMSCEPHQGGAGRQQEPRNQSGSIPTAGNGSQEASPCWYTSPEWWLVFVGIITFVAIWYQAQQTKEAAVATRIAAEAAQKSIKLQELQLIQWLVFQNWTGKITPRQHAENDLNIEFDLVNKTNFPLTLMQVTTRIGAGRSDHYSPHLMAPNVPFTVDFGLSVGADDERSYYNTSFIFGLRGNILFVDVMGVEREQPFGGYVVASGDGVQFHPHSALEQSAAEKEKTKGN